MRRVWNEDDSGVLCSVVLYPELHGRKSWSSGRVGEKYDIVLCAEQVSVSVSVCLVSKSVSLDSARTMMHECASARSLA
jgi:hypothetical protein